MKKEKGFSALASQIIESIGGKDNISYLIHCLTRLRFNVKDKSKINVERISNLNGVVGTQWQGDKFQVIIGQDVGDVYKEVCKQAHIDMKEQLDEELSDTPKGKISVAAIFDGISGTVAPLLPLLIGGGLLRVLLMLSLQFSLLDTSSQTYIVLSYATDAMFHYLPVFIGATGARKFGANMGYGMLLGAILVFPAFAEAVGSGVSLSIIGIPIYSATYSSSVFPMIMTTFILAKVERFFTKRSPEIIRSITVPLFTLFVMITLMLVVIAPAGAIIGNYLSYGIVWLYETLGFVSVGILSGVFAFLVVTGTHTALLPALIGLQASLGFEPLLIIGNALYTINQGVVTLAVALRSKDAQTKSAAFAATISSFIAGISEPALFGVSLKNRKLIYSSMIGCFFGGIYAGLMNVVAYGMPGSVGFLVAPVFYGGSIWDIVHLFIAIGISSIITFCLSYFVVLKKEVGGKINVG